MSCDSILLSHISMYFTHFFRPVRIRWGQTDTHSEFHDLFFSPDPQQAQVYPCRKMSLYNMFNHHFFEPQGEARFRSFLREAGAGLVLVTDPPFGGMVEPLVATFTKIEETWKAEVKAGENEVARTGFKVHNTGKSLEKSNFTVFVVITSLVNC